MIKTLKELVSNKPISIAAKRPKIIYMRTNPITGCEQTCDSSCEDTGSDYGGGCDRGGSCDTER